jgi:hypothetical protein
MRHPMQNAAARHDADHDCYVVEVGGKFVSEYGTLKAALNAAFAFKNRDAKAQVKIYDAKERA